VLIRAGHTEAAVDLARMAGLIPAGVICEILNDDGTMARMPDLLPFAQRHGLKIGTIADLIAYRRRHERLVKAVAERAIETPFGGGFKLKIFESQFGNAEHLALVKGDVTTPEPVLVRMHAVNIFEDILGIGQTKGRRSLIERAMRIIGEEGRGVVVLVRTVPEKGSSAKLVDLAAQHASQKEDDGEKRLVDYGIGAQILLDLGVRDMVLLSNSPTPKIVGLEGYGLNLRGRRPFDEK
jgi:3,4-dihydroxy 2-butanone 4-phosphate synthase/GTP cyclohydrolase II